MALITCPECGTTISDQADRCPKCGFPMQKYDQSGNSAVTPSKLKSKNFMTLLICGLVILIIGAIMVVSLLPKTVSTSSISIKDISIDNWRLVEDYTDFGFYEATVTTNETDPFVAVIGLNESNSGCAALAFVNDGSGVLKALSFYDEDPSIEYRVIGFMTGCVISETDISDISYRNFDYSDYEYLEESSCTVELEVQFKQKLNGLLFFGISNDLSNDIDYNCYAIVTDGKLEYSYYVSSLPYKTRGIEVSLVPLYFCKSNRLTEDDYTIEQAFNIVTEKSTYDYLDVYNGSEIIRLDDCKDGFVTYITTLTNGGDKTERNVPRPNFANLVDEKCIINTYDSYSKDDHFSTPFYEITILGYISYEEINQ